MGTITIRHWDRYQHYRKRNPPWIKLHRSLLQQNWYRQLSDNAARFLMELWLLASRHGGIIPYDSLMILRECERPASHIALLHSALRELASAGAITVAGEDASASFLATLERTLAPTLAPREYRGDRGAEEAVSVIPSLRSGITSTDADASINDTIPPLSQHDPKIEPEWPRNVPTGEGSYHYPSGETQPEGPFRPNASHSGTGSVPRGTTARLSAPPARDEVTDGELMALVRQWLYVPDGREPVGWSAGRDVAIIRALRRSGIPGSDIRDAILGLAILREAGELPWLRPGQKATMRALYDTGHGVLPLFTAALTAYYRAQNRRTTGQDPVESDVHPNPVPTNQDAEHVGAILQRRGLAGGAGGP